MLTFRKSMTRSSPVIRTRPSSIRLSVNSSNPSTPSSNRTSPGKPTA